MYVQNCNVSVVNKWAVLPSCAHAYITEEHPWIFTIMLGTRLQIMWPLTLFATFADLLFRKVATFANLQLYTRQLFIRIAQWSDSHCFWFALCTCVINLAFWFFHTIYRYKDTASWKSTSKNGAPIPVRSKIMWHTGDLYMANKELNVLMARIESRLLHKGHTFQNNDIAVWTNKIEFSNSNTIY